MIKHRHLALAWLLLACPSLYAQDAKENDSAKPIFTTEGKLTENDPLDSKLKGSHRKVHKIKLEKGVLYRIDVESDEFDTYLRLLDGDDESVAENDDGGAKFNSRLLFKPEKGGSYKAVVTTYNRGETGKYTISLRKASEFEGLAYAAGNLPRMSRDEQEDFLGKIRKSLEAKGGSTDLDDLKLAYMIGTALERSRQAIAPKAYKSLGTVLAKSNDEKVAKFGNMLQGAARRLTLVGEKLDIKGTTLAGKEFDWSKYRGKVVLVDFWATWCGPCRAEFPGMRKMYEAYKDRGFEIVGVSVDRDRDALEAFQKREELPWLILHEKGEERNPLSTELGIFTIPLAILVDREGRVVSTSARGGTLVNLLEKQIGPIEPAATE